MAKCLTCIYKLWSFIKATITRLLFVLHAFTLILFIYFAEELEFEGSGNEWLQWFRWYLSCPILLLFFEGIVTCCLKKNHEWKWFCPSIFLYLSSVVPAIWLIEWQKISIYQSECLKSYKVTENSLEQLSDKFELFNGTTNNSVTTSEDSFIYDYDFDYLDNLRFYCSIIEAVVKVATFLELLLMLILIIGRWLLPKGYLTRDQLSQLLLSYIGITADITEMFHSLQAYKTMKYLKLVNWTLGIWTLSLVQFVIVLPTTNSKKSRLSIDSVSQENVQTEVNCCNIDVCRIILSIILQDGPFFIFRMVLICYYRIITHTNIFFTCKNILVLIIQFDRLYVIFTKSKMNKQNKKRRDINVPNINNISQYVICESIKMRNLGENNKIRHISI
ncbi:transmembrane protein 26-like [Cardiocondyla obscurior]|uniref:transmembrane protein 26-like n=1 Tax=Cardiocondyla obscurior TaxID=286306 RepID=UPI0039656F20